jgi:hypothetical protein
MKRLAVFLLLGIFGCQPYNPPPAPSPFKQNRVQTQPKKLAKLSRPVLVELFTSQGCSSCPPADFILHKLSKDPEILALSYHVDYWDYIGWKDPFSKKKFTQRQKKYAHNYGETTLYTPQILVDGKYEALGSREKLILNKIKNAKKEIRDAKIGVVDMRQEKINKNQIKITIPKNTYHLKSKFDILLIIYDKKHQTYVSSGENRGLNIKNTNVVKSLRKLGTWDGRKQQITIDLEGQRGKKLIILQKENQGEFLSFMHIEHKFTYN